MFTPPDHARGATLVACVLLASCAADGPSTVGEAVRPEAHTASEALGERAPTFDCQGVAPVSETLVVDWRDQERLDLALSLQEGLAVVRYSCEGIKLLKHCRLPGDYKFAGVPMIQNVVELDNVDAVRASLPVQGATLGASLKGESSITIAIALIGRKTTLVNEPSQSELSGGADCAGATHYVRAAYVGAFNMATGTGGEAAATAEYFGVGGSAESRSTRKQLSTQGEIAACKAYDPEATPNPPRECSAHIRLELAPIAQSATPAPTGPAGDKANAPLPNVCGPGFVLSKGGCTPKARAKAYRCDPRDIDDCVKQCLLGEGGSCYNAGQGFSLMGIHPPGTKVPPGRDRETMRKKARTWYEKACAADVGEGCNALAGYLIEEAQPEKARELMERACYRLLSARACASLGGIWAFGVKGWKKDPRRAVPLYSRACDLGDAGGCGSLADAYLKGEGVKADPKRGIEVLERACNQARYPSLCWSIGDYAQKGKYGKKDPARAAEYMKKACDYGLRSDACKR